MDIKTKVGAKAPTGETETENNGFIKTVLMTNIFKILCLLYLVVSVSSKAVGYTMNKAAVSIFGDSFDTDDQPQYFEKYVYKDFICNLR